MSVFFSVVAYGSFMLNFNIQHLKNRLRLCDLGNMTVDKKSMGLSMIYEYDAEGTIFNFYCELDSVLEDKLTLIIKIKKEEAAYLKAYLESDMTVLQASVHPIKVLVFKDNLNMI